MPDPVPSAASYTGGCLCGAVRLECRTEPYRVGVCHCLDCRKHSGSVFSILAIFPATSVTVTGTTAQYNDRHFCPACGSSLFGTIGDEIDVPVGCFDEPNRVRPTYELWTRRREDWLPEFDVARRHESDRPGTGRTEP
ncbi:GFA family protein [Thalassobaculum sp.]|uniref:GFA family protein n=1 Tax=Thalassobaculum sp. TaxID=2022740 RepID=UPI0032EDDE60